MDSHKPLVSIITLNFNQLELTCALLDSINKVSYPNLEVFVVDNASKTDPFPHIRASYPNVHCLQSGANLGFAGGNNVAVRQCKGDYLFFVNNDAEITEDCIEKLLAVLQSDPKIGIVSPLLCYYPSEETNHKTIIQYAGTSEVHPLTARNKTFGAGQEWNGQYTQIQETAYAHGAAMMVPREVIEKVGMMEESFFLYYEELDWCASIKKAGYKIYIEPNALVYHKESVTVGKANPLKTYYQNRNRILFMRRHHGGLSLFIFYLFLLFFTIPKNTLKFLIQGDFAHVKAFWRAILWNIGSKDIAQVTKNALVATQKNSQFNLESH